MKLKEETYEICDKCGANLNAEIACGVKGQALREFTHIIKSITRLRGVEAGSTGFLSDLETAAQKLLLEFFDGVIEGGKT